MRRKRNYKYDEGKIFVVSLFVVGLVVALAITSGWTARLGAMPVKLYGLLAIVWSVVLSSIT